MIRELTGGVPPVSPDSETAVRLLCLAEAYGTGCGFVHFWQGTGCLLAQLDGHAYVLETDGDMDAEETGCFLSMHPDIGQMRTDAGTAAKLLPWLPGWQLEQGEVMSPAAAFTPSSLPRQLPPQQIYPLMTACFGEAVPPFEAWYMDVNHRLRHGFCRIAAIAENGQAAASAMTTAECAGGAVIGAVATLPSCRGRGLASLCVSALTASLQQEKRHIFLSPKNAYAAGLYAHLGYEACAGWATLTRPGICG